MKAYLLDGSHSTDTTGLRVSAALRAPLEAQGWEVEHVVLRERTIHDCGGCFHCWTHTPGTCIFDDDNRTIAAALATSDLAVYLTPVTFGGVSSRLKRAVDHKIQNISPFFKSIDGETHHHRRYRRSPDLLAVGWLDAADPPSEALFRTLVSRNSINWHSRTCVSDVVAASVSAEELSALAQRWLGDLRDGRSSVVEPPAISVPDAVQGDDVPGPERALLLVGSPRMGKSTSNAVGTYLLEQLSEHGIETDTLYAHAALRSPEKTQALLDAVEAADLMILSFPLYVDSLPAPAIAALERIAAARRRPDPSRRQAFAAICNSGFPEAAHNNLALGICGTFSRQGGFAWAGGLALGAGGMVAGRDLTQMGGQTLALRGALDQAAEALAQGHPIPEAAQAAVAAPVIPAWMYRLMGNTGWIVTAARQGALRNLWRRPYADR